jgi:hypothetical protein
MSHYKLSHNDSEKGVVLVAALLITAILFMMALTLSYNMSSYLRTVASVRAKSQDYYSSLGGVELTRAFLGNNIDGTNFNSWGGLLDGGTGTYRDVTSLVTGTTHASIPGVSGSTYTVFAKDNDDADSNFAIDNDQIVLVSVVSRNPALQTSSTIEAMLIFNQKGITPYASANGSDAAGGGTLPTGTGGPSESVTTNIN